jgi:hypothetical protein
MSAPRATRRSSRADPTPAKDSEAQLERMTKRSTLASRELEKFYADRKARRDVQER